MINLDQKYESYVRNGTKKLRIDGIEERVRGYGYTDDGKDIDGYYLITDNYTLFYNREEQFLRMEALGKVAQEVAWASIFVYNTYIFQKTNENCTRCPCCP